MAKKDYDNEDGVWRTIHGRKVFIKNGQSLQDAMKESGKFNNTKTEIKKDNNKVDDDKKKKEDEEETEEELDKKYDEAHKKQKDEKKGISDEIKNEVREVLKQDSWDEDLITDIDDYDNFDDYKMAVESELETMIDEGNLDKDDADYLMSNLNDVGTGRNYKSEQEAEATSEVSTDDPRSQITSDDLDNDVNFKITGKDGSTNYINAFWSWNDIDEEDIPEGEDPEDWRAIAYNVLDENGEEIDGGMMITDQENFNAEDLCKDLAEMSGYSRDMEVSRIDDGDYEEAIENDKSSNEESDLDKVKRIQNDLSKKDNLTQAEKDWQSQLNDTQKKLENGKSREDIIKDLDEEASKSQTQKGLSERDAQDLIKELNDEGSDFMFSDPTIEDGKLKTEVSVFMPDERGLTSRELEIPLGEFENYASLEEKIRDWQSKHSSPDTFYDDDDFNSSLKDYRDRNGMSQEENIERQRLINDYRANASKEDYLSLINDTMQKDVSNDEIKQRLDEAKKSTKTEATPNYDKYSADEQDILDRYGEDYGYPKGDKLKNLKGQIDYMRNPNESIRQTAERLVEGGDFLIYNDDVEDYLKERNIKYNDDNFFDKYKEDMAEKIEKLYNDASNETMNDTIREKAKARLDKMKEAHKKQYNEEPNYNEKSLLEDLENQEREKIKRQENSFENKISNTTYTPEQKARDEERYNKVKEIEKRTGKPIATLSDNEIKQELNKLNNQTMNNAIREKAGKSTNDDFQKWMKDNKVDYDDYQDFVEKRSSLNPNKYDNIEDYNKAVQDQYLKHNKNKSTNETMNDNIRKKAKKKK